MFSVTDRPSAEASMFLCDADSTVRKHWLKILACLAAPRPTVVDMVMFP